MPFDQLRGHRRSVDMLQRMLRSGRVPQALLFSGTEGIGKHAAATAFVKALNCRRGEDDFCGECSGCRKIDGRVHPDVVFIEREPGKSAVAIDQVREAQKDIAYPPLEGRKKAVVIDQAETLSSGAANCLLKTLEEPPDDTVIILVSCAAGRMLPTILSRCQHIRFAPLAQEDITGILTARGHDPAEAALAARLAQGSLARAALLMDPGYRERRAAMAEALQGHGCGSTIASALALARSLGGDKENADMALAFLWEWYRDMLLTVEHMPERLLCNPDMADRLRAASAGARVEDIMGSMRKINVVQKDAALNIDAQHTLESILVR